MIRTGLLTLLLAFAHRAAADRLTVVDESDQPIAGASITIGLEDDSSPAQTTDEAGQAEVPVDAKAELPLTVRAPGFVTTTIALAEPGLGVIRLAKADPTMGLEIKGTTTGYGPLVSDGLVDFGLVMPGLSRENMLSFDVASIISPSSDSLTILGNEVKIPSNLALPEQRETFVLPITLNKPTYRMSVRAAGPYKFGALHGQFPLKTVVNDIRAGKSFLEVVNYFDFKEGAQRDLVVKDNVDGFDMPVNQIPFNTTFSVQAPAFDQSLAMVSLSLMEQNGVFMPTDVKRFKPGQTIALRGNSAAGNVANLSVLLDIGNSHWAPPLLAVNPDFNRLSFAFTPSAAGGARPIFLRLIGKPSLAGNVMTFDAPTAPAGLQPLAMYLSFAEVEHITNGNVSTERRTRLWDVWSDPWLSRFELPKFVWTRRPDRTYRWDVLFLATPISGAPGVRPRVDLKQITHATRNSLDI